MSPPTRIRPRDRDAILQSLAAGVVPRIGQQHIQVGRANEVEALLRDLDRIADDGASVRFAIGEYGSGKSFFLQLVRSVALEKGLATVHADLSPERRLHATGGQARTLYTELTRNLATRSSPEGGAVGAVVERFVSSTLSDARDNDVAVETVIQNRLGQLSEMVGGYDFADVVAAYWRGHDTGNDQLKADAVRWLRGEYATKTDARRALGVRTIIDDSNVYDMLKLLARFTTLAGYTGLLVVLDEMVNLYKLAHTASRTNNYEQILRIVNDCLQGTTSNIGFVMAGTPEFLVDTRRGLYSYEALHSRLAENQFAVEGMRDLSGPVIRLTNLSPEELYVLLTKLRHVQALGDEQRYLLPDEALKAFMAHCSRSIGAAYFRTPRNTIKAFVQLMAILEHNPDADWRTLVSSAPIDEDANPDLAPLDESAEEDAAPAPEPGAGTGTADPVPPPPPRTPEQDALEQETNGDDDGLATFRL